MTRTLGLMCGSGTLPARMAAEARRQGWRVAAFTFADVPEVVPLADWVIPSRLAEAGPVLAELRHREASAVLFSGRFALGDVLTAHPDAAGRRIAEQAGSLAGPDLFGAIVALLGELGISVLDQRAFISEWLAGEGCWSARAPTPGEWSDIWAGIRVARMIADAGIGQAVAVKRGAVVAVEAGEGTTAMIQRGTALGGPGVVIVKAAARDHDYRFDTPMIGPETVAAAAVGGAAAIAVEAGRVAVAEREATVGRADLAGITLVGVSDGAS